MFLSRWTFHKKCFFRWDTKKMLCIQNQWTIPLNTSSFFNSQSIKQSITSLCSVQVMSYLGASDTPIKKLANSPFNPFVPRKKKFSEIAQILVCHRYWKENNFLFLKNFCISFISWDMRCTLQCTLGIWAKVGTFPVKAFGTLYCTCVHYTVLWANRHFFSHTR